MRFYIPDNEYDFFYENVEAVIELVKKAYNSTKCYYEDDKKEDEADKLQEGHVMIKKKIFFILTLIKHL